MVQLFHIWYDSQARCGTNVNSRLATLTDTLIRRGQDRGDVWVKGRRMAITHRREEEKPRGDAEGRERESVVERVQEGEGKRGDAFLVYSCIIEYLPKGEKGDWDVD